MEVGYEDDDGSFKKKHCAPERKKGSRIIIPSHILHHQFRPPMVQQRIQIPAVKMHLHAPCQDLGQNPIRRRLYFLSAQRVEDRSVAAFNQFVGRVDRFADGRLVEPRGGAGIIARVVASGEDVVRVEAGVEGGEVGEGGGVGCAAHAAGGVDGGVDERGVVGDGVEAGDLTFSSSLFVSTTQEVEAFGVTGDVHLAPRRVGELGDDFVEPALLVCGGEGGEDWKGDFVDAGDLVEVGCCNDGGHGRGVAEGCVAEDDGFEVDVEDVAVGEEGFGEVGDLWLPCC